MEHPQSLHGHQTLTRSRRIIRFQVSASNARRFGIVIVPPPIHREQSPKATNTEIDIMQFEKSPEAKQIPDDHFLSGLDRQTGETFGNPSSQSPRRASVRYS